LPAAEAERLDGLFRATDNRKLRDRLQIVLMAHRGRARQDIAADLGVHRKTVTRWLNAYCDAGLDGLQPRKAKGKPGQIPAAPAAAGSSTARPSKDWTGPTGRTRNSRTTSAKPEASGPPAAPCSATAPRSAFACTGRPTTTSGVTPPSRPKPRRTWPTWEKGG